MQIRINTLINNAGIGGTHYFDERDTEFYYKQIELNVVSPTILTHLFIQNLSPYSPAYVLNVSSLDSFFTCPKNKFMAEQNLTWSLSQEAYAVN